MTSSWQFFPLHYHMVSFCLVFWCDSAIVLCDGCMLFIYSIYLTHWPCEILKCDFKNVIFSLALLIGTFKSSCDNVLRWMAQDLTDNKSTLVQVMAWCRQTTSHFWTSVNQDLQRHMASLGPNELRLILRHWDNRHCSSVNNPEGYG